MSDKRVLEEILVEVREIRAILKPTGHRAMSATLTFKTISGDNMPATIAVGGKGGQALYQEFDGPNGTGNKVPPTGTVTYSSENTGVATVDTSSGLLTAVAAGTVTIDGVDSGTGIKASDILTVTPAVVGVAQSATLTLTAL